MPVAIEFSLHAKPGHYDQVLQAYADFVAGLEAELDDLQMIFVVGEPTQDLVRGIAIYEHAEVAEDLASTPYFARLIDVLEPHLASTPERLELELLAVLTGAASIGPNELEGAVVVEATLRAKLGHMSELVAAHTAYSAQFQKQVPDAVLILDVAQPAAGLLRAVVLYEHADVAAQAPTHTSLGDFLTALEPLLAEPITRTQLPLVHAFSRG